MPDAHSTDDHGHSLPCLSITYFIGIDLRPRIANLKHKELFSIDAVSTYSYLYHLPMSKFRTLKRWIGSPAIALPRREIRDDYPPHLTYQPSKLRKIARGLLGFRFSIHYIIE
jgi:hypothetical protein